MSKRKLADVSFATKTPQIAADARVHPSANIMGSVEIASGANVWPGAVIRGDAGHISIGEDSAVEDNVTIHAATEVGARVVIGHNAVVHGCVLEDGCLVGMGAIVMDNARVGAGALVAAGSLVPMGMEIPAHHLALGSPAKVIGPLNESQTESVLEGPETYRALAERELPLYGAAAADELA